MFLFFGRESYVLVWEVLYQLSISTSQTSLCLSSSSPREPAPPAPPPPIPLLAQGSSVGCVFFVGNDDVLPTQSKIVCQSVSLSASLANRVRYSQSSTLCLRVIECFSPCLVCFFRRVGPQLATVGRGGPGGRGKGAFLGVPSEARCELLGGKKIPNLRLRQAQFIFQLFVRPRPLARPSPPLPGFPIKTPVPLSPLSRLLPLFPPSFLSSQSTL